MYVPRSSTLPALTGFALIALLAVLGGCEILAGIGEKTLSDGGIIPGVEGVDGGSVMVPGGVDPGGVDPACLQGGPPDAVCPPTDCNAEMDTKSDRCNCGACGHSCSGGTCSDGVCAPMTMLSGLPSIDRVATNGTSVFFASRNATDNKSTLYGLPRRAGDLSAMSALPYAFGSPIQGAISAIAADCSRVYLSPQSPDAMGKVHVYALSLNGKKLDLIASVDAPVSQIIADGARAYWTGGNMSKGFVEMWDPATMMRSTLSQPPTSGLAVDTTHLYWSVTDKDPKTSGIRRARISELGLMPIVEIVIQGRTPTAIAVDDAFVYWVETGSSSTAIFRAKKEGSDGAKPASLVTGSIEHAIAVDATNVYWIEDNTIRKRSKEGNDAPVVLADRTPFGKAFQSHWLTIDRSRVYFADTSTNSSTVMWVAK